MLVLIFARRSGTSLFRCEVKKKKKTSWQSHRATLPCTVTTSDWANWSATILNQVQPYRCLCVCVALALPARSLHACRTIHAQIDRINKALQNAMLSKLWIWLSPDAV